MFILLYSLHHILLPYNHSNATDNIVNELISIYIYNNIHVTYVALYFLILSQHNIYSITVNISLLSSYLSTFIAIRSSSFETITHHHHLHNTRTLHLTTHSCHITPISSMMFTDPLTYSHSFSLSLPPHSLTLSLTLPHSHSPL